MLITKGDFCNAFNKAVIQFNDFFIIGESVHI